ncbi:MAG: DUF3108 domain-containing protein [Pseudomonadota bacterium]
MAARFGKPPSRRLLAALAVSLLLHVWFTGSLDFSRLPEPLAPPPIEARLTGPATTPARAAPPAQARIPRLPPAQTQALAAPTAESAPPETGTAPAAADPAPPAQTEPGPALASAPGPDAAPALPEAFRIRFSVQGNEGGLVLGQLEHVWQRSGDHYSLVGVARATGLLALFYSGLLSQTSTGRITPEGLQPESYWLLRGKRTYTAVFDWPRATVRLGTPYGALTLQPGTQDFLSVVYQVALFPRPATGTVVVVNGKRAREYHYQELGRETLRLPLGEVETLRLRIGQGGQAEDLELWLRAEPPQLPVKMTLVDEKGRTGVLLAEAIE